MSIGSHVDDGIDFIKGLAKGQTILHSNKAINPLENFTGGLEYIGRSLNTGNWGDSIGKTFGKVQKNAAGEIIGRSAENGYDIAKIAGSYLGVAGAGRLMTGGGIYKDGNGNTNLIGVPFV